MIKEQKHNVHAYIYFTIITSGIAIILSLVTIFRYDYRTNLEIDYLGGMVAIISLAVTVFVTVQIYQSFNLKKDIDEALLTNLFDRSGYLYEEPANLLKQELREPAIYNAIIKAIAEGSSRAADICGKVQETSTTVLKYLKTLMELGIVKKETPLTEKAGRKTIYLLADNFFRFWYKFVPNNANAIDSGRIARIYSQTVKRYFSDYMGLVFEKMCQDYLLYYAKSLPIELVDIGQWWGTDAQKKKQVQIDIVATGITPDAYIIGSCKYRNEKIGLDELE
uniref:ATP-binding protein n=1 Tax=Phascolarctobacterium succinatutens TaxID=626940 RepID=UPI0026EFC72D